MAKQHDVRRIALALEGVTETAGHFGFAVRNKGKDKGFVWAWRERIDPKKARVPSSTVIAVRVANELEKQMLLSVDPDKFFTEPHYNGYPAVLVRLPAVTLAELREVVVAAWRCQGPASDRSIRRPQRSKDGGILGASGPRLRGERDPVAKAKPAAKRKPKPRR